MLRLIVLGLACIALSCAEPEVEPETAESKSLYYPKGHEYSTHGHNHGHEDLKSHSRHESRDYVKYFSEDDHDLHDRYSYPSDRLRGHRYNSKEGQIIENVFSPDYHEPTVVLDFRYLKSGGRKYVRGPGGQLLILPKSFHSDDDKHYPDYDSLIEFLRLKHLAKSKDDHNLESHHRHNVHPAKHDQLWY